MRLIPIIVGLQEFMILQVRNYYSMNLSSLEGSIRYICFFYFTSMEADELYACSLKMKHCLKIVS